MEVKPKIVPYHPEWAKTGCTVIKSWEREVKSGTAVGIAYMVQYKNPKGSIRECMKWVKWK